MRDYDARRLELLAVILALEHFKPYIDGVRVSLDTDHRNLQFIRDVRHSSGQLARWAMRLSEYDFELKYRPGKQMEVADCLSRNPLPIEVTEEEMAPILYTFNVTQQECGNSAMFEGKPIEDSGSLFQVTWGPVGQRATTDEAAALKATSEQVSHASDARSSVTSLCKSGCQWRALGCHQRHKH